MTTHILADGSIYEELVPNGNGGAIATQSFDELWEHSSEYL